MAFREQPSTAGSGWGRDVGGGGGRECGGGRKTFYFWEQRYEEAKLREAFLIEALGGRYAVGDLHRRWTPPIVVSRVLEAVVAEPRLSVHRLKAQIPDIGHHAIQNILLRYSLNTFERRLAYAQAHTPVTLAVRPALSWPG